MIDKGGIMSEVASARVRRASGWRRSCRARRRRDRGLGGPRGRMHVQAAAQSLPSSLRSNRVCTRRRFGIVNIPPQMKVRSPIVPV